MNELYTFKKPILIGINGEIGCGKSTSANYLIDTYNFTEYMFAKPLKDIAVILGFEENQIFGTQDQKLEINNFWGISGRQFLQIFGSEVCRDFVPKAIPEMKFNGLTMWVRLFEKYYNDNISKNIVVSDVRFEDESNMIKKNGGYIIRLERLHTEKNVDHISEHKSELQKALIKPHFIIKNTGSILTLQLKINQIIDIINGNDNINDNNPYYF